MSVTLSLSLSPTPPLQPPSPPLFCCARSFSGSARALELRLRSLALALFAPPPPPYCAAYPPASPAGERARPCPAAPRVPVAGLPPVAWVSSSSWPPPPPRPRASRGVCLPVHVPVSAPPRHAFAPRAAPAPRPGPAFGSCRPAPAPARGRRDPAPAIRSAVPLPSARIPSSCVCSFVRLPRAASSPPRPSLSPSVYLAVSHTTALPASPPSPILLPPTR